MRVDCAGGIAGVAEDDEPSTRSTRLDCRHVEPEPVRWRNVDDLEPGEPCQIRIQRIRGVGDKYPGTGPTQSEQDGAKCAARTMCHEDLIVPVRAPCPTGHDVSQQASQFDIPAV